MIDKYILMHKDIEVGDFLYDIAAKEFSFILYESIKNNYHLPLGMYRYDNWNIRYKPTNEDIKFRLEERVVPNERPNILEILNSINLKEYDVWEICRRTRDMRKEDFFGLVKEKSIKMFT